MKCKKNISQDEIGKNISGSEDNLFRIEYTDEINGLPGSSNIKGIGSKFSTINGFFLDYLNAYNIPTGFKKLSENCLFIQNHYRFPCYCKILNVSDARAARIFETKAGQVLNFPVIQFHYGCSRENIISESHLYAFDICSTDELKFMKRICSKVNAVLKPFFERRNAVLAEINCYFGKDDDKIFLVDDFTPLSLRILPSGASAKNNRIRNVDDLLTYTDLILSFTNI